MFLRTFVSAAVSLACVPAWSAEWPGEADPAPWTTTATGLALQDTVTGTGPVVEDGSTVSVHYTGMLVDGSVFDSSLDRGEPFAFRVGGHQVIAGWEEGLVGMHVGGTRRLVIPPDLGYGSRAAGPIPPESTLFFEVQLLEARPPRRPPPRPSEVALRELPGAAGGGVRIGDVALGSGRRVHHGGRACADWAVWGTDGQPVEDTYARRACTWLLLDGTDLPADVERGLFGMREGGQRQIVRPTGEVWEFQVDSVGIGRRSR